jgi:hypothetical protein
MLVINIILLTVLYVLLSHHNILPMHLLYNQIQCISHNCVTFCVLSQTSGTQTVFCRTQFHRQLSGVPQAHLFYSEIGKNNFDNL